MPKKQCVCGELIPSNRSLCIGCREIYGVSPSDWPEWLRWMVADIQREWDYERNHDVLEYFDDYAPEGLESDWRNFSRVINNLIRAEQDPEMDFEDFIWNNV